MKRLLSLSRYIVLIPVISSLIGATVLMIYGGIQTIIESVHTAELILEGSDKGIKKESIAFIELVDVFLLATVLYIIGVGLYELFIGELDLPAWLVIKTLDDLKVKLINIVVTVLAVLFLGHVVTALSRAAIAAHLETARLRHHAGDSGDLVRHDVLRRRPLVAFRTGHPHRGSTLRRGLENR